MENNKETQQSEQETKFKQEQEEFNKQKKPWVEPDLKKVETLETLDI